MPRWGREAQRQACGASITDHVQQSLTVVEATCHVPLGVGAGERLQASLLVEAAGPGEAARIDVRCARSPTFGPSVPCPFVGPFSVPRATFDGTVQTDTKMSGDRCYKEPSWGCGRVTVGWTLRGNRQPLPGGWGGRR